MMNGSTAAFWSANPTSSFNMAEIWPFPIKLELILHEFSRFLKRNESWDDGFSQFGYENGDFEPERRWRS